MKTVSIVGVGMGPDTLTREGQRAIEEAGLVIGAPRLLSLFCHAGTPSLSAYTPEPVVKAVRESAVDRVAVLVSGDVGFYSAAGAIARALSSVEADVATIPGISSLNYFFAKLGLSWADAALVSCHGRAQNLTDTVRRSRLTFALTGGNAPALAGELAEAGFGSLQVEVGEDLGSDREHVFSCTVSDLSGRELSSLTVLLVKNPDADPSVPTGIPDERFIRGSVPMTKAEVRAVILSKLGLSPGDICWDVGAGTGSVTVEMALSAYRGHVYAIDRNEEAIELIRQNCLAFHLGNVTPILGSAPQAMETLPPADAAFIGGSGGTMERTVNAVLARNPRARIVISAIALETVGAAMNALSSAGLIPEVVQLSVARAKQAGKLHLLMAQNPIFLISAGGRP